MTITTIIRFHDLSQIERLKNCLFSLENQETKPDQVLLLIQTRDDEIEGLNSIKNIASLFDLNIGIHLFTSEGPLKSDLRTKLLNFGIAQSKTDLIHILDYDDVIFEHAYTLASKAAKNDDYQSLLYFFRVKRCFVDSALESDYICTIDSPWRGTSKRELLSDNFCPIHSYFINLRYAKLSSVNLNYDESYDVLEDYEFLLRYSNNPYNFSQINKFIGLYNFRNDGLNTTVVSDCLHSDPGMIRSVEAKRRAWDNGRERINDLKKIMAITD